MPSLRLLPKADTKDALRNEDAQNVNRNFTRKIARHVSSFRGGDRA